MNRKCEEQVQRSIMFCFSHVELELALETEMCRAVGKEACPVEVVHDHGRVVPGYITRKVENYIYSNI